MSGSRRNQILTDQPVQGELLFRALIYWCFCMVMLEICVAGWLYINEPSANFWQVVRKSLEMNAPAFFCSMFLLPLILFDLLRVSSRFAGPVQSVRLTLRQLAEGKPARRVYLRRDDFWQDLAHYANLVADKVEVRTDETQEPWANDTPTHQRRSELADDDSKTPTKPTLFQEDLIEV